jgi:hypothetical protein
MNARYATNSETQGVVGPVLMGINIVKPFTRILNSSAIGPLFQEACQSVAGLARE